MLHNLSFRYKIPVRGTILVIVTAVIVTASLMISAYDDMRSNLLRSADGISRLMVRTLVPAMLHDDVWQAYEIINAPYGQPSDNNVSADIVMVLDAQGQVYVANQPRQFPIQSDISNASTELRTVKHIALHELNGESQVIEEKDAQYLYRVTPLISDEVVLGSLVMGYPRAMFLPRFVNIARRGAFITMLCLAVLLPLNWYWGHRMAKPLVQLANCMGRVGAAEPAKMHCDLYESDDEIGQVGASFKRMLHELTEKQALEKQMVTAERLAAIGRLTATIAHEINNPLGGMLNAIDTFKHHGNCNNPRTHRTMSLLERGLLQIRDTVAALLVEAKAGGHRLSPQDIDDVHTLISPNVSKKGARLEWSSAINETINLPATPVRQILINLLLNAVNATDTDGKVTCRIWNAHDHLYIEVENDGQHIRSEQMGQLFEPFSPVSEEGHGLGLWVCYQIVQQLGGEIGVNSEPGLTRFALMLPVEERQV